MDERGGGGTEVQRDSLTIEVGPLLKPETVHSSSRSGRKTRDEYGRRWGTGVLDDGKGMDPTTEDTPELPLSFGDWTTFCPVSSLL